MSNYQKAKDVFTQRKVVDGTFEEYPLIVQPNSVLVTDSNNNLVMVTSSSFIAGTGSIAHATSASFAGTASYAYSASYASNVSATSSMALSLQPGASIYLSQSYIYSNLSASAPPFVDGQLWWDKISHTYTIDTLQSRLQLGQENYIRAIAGEFIPNGSAVYINGADIDPDAPAVPTVKIPVVFLAIADGTGLHASVVGIIRADTLSGSTGYVLQAGVVHGVNMTGFNIGDTLWLSNITPGGFINSNPGQPYETIELGYCQVNGSGGSFIVSVTPVPAPANAYAGLTNYPLLVDNTSSFTLLVNSSSVNLYNNSTGVGAIIGYNVPGKTFSIPTATSASFIYATTNGISASYAITNNETVINGINTVRVATVYRADEDVHWMESNSEGLALSNKLENRLFATEKFAYESGFILSDTGSNQFLISAGKVWFGATQISQDQFDSRLTQSAQLPSLYNETHWVYHSQSNYIIPTASAFQQLGRYNNSYYDNGTNLTPLTNGYYCTNYFYRILGDNLVDHDTFIVIGESQYVSLTAAESDTVPPNIPNVLNDVGVLVGRMIVLSSSLSASKIESSYNTSFAAAAVTTHNSLLGLQGGQGGEYYHLTNADYAGTGTGVVVRQTGAIISSPIITGLNATGSLQGSASYATTANAAVTAASATNSTYATSASWASSSISASIALTASFVTASNIYGVLSVLQAPVAYSASWVSASVTITTSQTASYISSSTTFDLGKVYNHTASYATTAGTANSINFTPIFATIATSASWVSASVTITTSQTASYISSSTTFDLGKVYNHTASYATTAGTANAISFIPSIATSASWVSASNRITTTDSASYILGSNISGKISTAGTADTASYILSSNVSGKVSTAGNADTASYVLASNIIGTVAIATSASWASASISASYARTASIVTTIVGSNNYVPVFISNNLSSTSSIYASATQTAIGSASFDNAQGQEVLAVWGNSNIDPNGIASFYHTQATNSFAQVIIQNRSGYNPLASSLTGTASADLIMQSDVNENAQLGYLDVGINNQGYGDPTYSIGGPLDGYIYAAASASIGGNLNLGCDTSGKQIQFTVGGFTVANQIMQISDTVYPNVQVTGSFQATAGITGSLKGTASYAVSASYMNNVVVAAISSSDFTHTGDLTAVAATPLSFTMQAGETWMCNAYLTAQASNARGMVYAISSSAGTVADVEGWVYGVLNSITTLSRQRLTAVNTKIGTLIHTQANTPGPDEIQLCIINPSVATTISIAVAVSNTGDTVTVFRGSYIHARKIAG